MHLDAHDDRDKPTPEWTRPPEPPLHRAARKGDIDAMAKLLAAGAAIDVRADLEHDNGPHLKGLTTLMVAARSIDGATVETLRWLVAHGADIRARSAGTNTAAWYAAGHGGRWAIHRRAVTPDHAERLRYLLDLGLDPRECNFIGRSLLSEACETGDPARVALLLERGASAAAVGERAAQPIVCAARSGSAECVRLLLEAGADPDARDSLGRTALMSAGSAEVVRVLLAAGADRDATDPYGNDALHAAVESACGPNGCEPARFDVAKALVDAGADMGRLDEFGKNRLAVAAFAHQAEGVEILLALGARAGDRDANDSTPLHSICWQGEHAAAAEASGACERIIRALAAAGIPIDAADAYGQTPLHDAAGGDWGNATAIRTLLALGARSDPRDHAGNTPLMIAASRGEVECITLLLAAGADPIATNDEGRSALDEALSHLESWREIVADGPDPTVAELLRRSHEEVAREFGGDMAPPAPDIASLMAEQATNHAAALDQAERAAELLRRAAEARGRRG